MVRFNNVGESIAASVHPSIVGRRGDRKASAPQVVTERSVTSKQRETRLGWLSRVLICEGPYGVTLSPDAPEATLDVYRLVPSALYSDDPIFDLFVGGWRNDVS